MKNTIIFDLDGTLLDTLEDLTYGVNTALEAYGYPLRSQEEVRRFVGNGVRRLMKRALPQDLTEERFEEVFAYFMEYYSAHSRVKTRPYEGIPELLTELKQKGCRLAVVSNKVDAAVKDLIEYYFPGVFETAIGEREGVRKKPYPDSVLEAMGYLHAEKINTLYVGDSDVDKETADRVGVDCVLVDWGFRERELLESLKPYLLIHEPVELTRELDMEKERV